MSFIEKVVQIQTSDTELYQCPPTQSGSAHGLVFTNTTNVSQFITIKLYTFATGQTVPITSTAKEIPASGQFTWPKPINMNAGDKILAVATSGSSVTAIVSIYISTASNATAPFTVRGIWSSVANYLINDIVQLQGTSYVATADNTNISPPGAGWMIFAEKGDTGSLTNGGAFESDITLNGGNLVMTGTETVDGRDVSADGAIIDQMNSANGFVARTGSGSFANRSLTGTANQVTVTNGAGQAGNPAISLPNFVQFPGDDGIGLPIGATGQRDPSAPIGSFRYNTTNQVLETCTASGVWTNVVFDNDARLSNPTILKVRKTPGNGEFSSIGAAMVSITDSAVSKPYLIDVGPGVFIESTINFKTYVSVVGAGMDQTVIKSAVTNQHLIEGAERSGIESVTLTGSTGLNYAAVHMINSTGDMLVSFNVHNCRLGENSILVLAEKGYVIVDSCLMGSYFKFDYGFIARGLGGGFGQPGGFMGWINIRNTFSTGAFGGLNFASPQAIFIADGISCVLNIFSVGIRNSSAIDINSVGLWVRNGGTVLCMSLHLQRWGKGLWVENVGATPVIMISGANLRENIQDLVIDHPATIGNFYGNASRAVSSVHDSVQATVFYNDLVSQGIVNVGPIYLGDTHSKLVNITELITKTPTLGVLSGGEISVGAGLSVGVAAGQGFANVNGSIKKIIWSAGNVSVGPSSNNFIFITGSGNISQASSSPDPLTNIVLGQYLSNPSQTILVSPVTTNVNNFGNTVDKFNRLALGPIFVSGSIVSENAVTPRSIDVSSGRYFFSTTEKLPAAKTAVTFQHAHFLGGISTIVPATIVPNDTYSSGGNLTPLDSNQYVKHTLYTVGDGSAVQFVLAHGNAAFDTLSQAETAPITTSAVVPNSSPYIAAIIMQQGIGSIVSIIDLRPRIGFAAPSASASSTHGNLIGLEADDHTQYVLASGTRALTGDLNLATNDLVNVSLINGISIDDHSDRHLPTGADALPTAAAVGLSAASVNTAGTANSFARSDHTHSLAGVQASNLVLDGLSSVTGAGLLVKTGAGTATAVSIGGTSAQIIVSNGDGVSGSPSIALSDNAVMPGTEGMRLPSGTTAERNVSPTEGTVRYNADTGLTEFFEGGLTWQSFILDNDRRFNFLQTKIVRKTPGKNEYSSIAAAMDSITDASSTKPYLLDVRAGVFEEPVINAKQFVHIRGSGIDVTVIKPVAANQHLFECVERGSLSNVTVTGVVSVGYAALHMVNSTGDTNTTFNVDNIRFGNNHMHGYCEKGYVSVNSSYWGSNFYFDDGFVARGLDANTNARFLMRNCTSTGILGGVSQTAPQHMFWADGPKSLINILFCAFRNGTAVIDPNMTGMRLTNGATSLIYSSHIERWGKGIWAENTGVAPTVQAIGAGLFNNTWDLYLEHPGTKGSFSGIATRTKCHVDSSVPATIFYTDLNSQGIVNVGPVYSGRTHDTLVDVSPLINRGFQLGVLSGGEVTVGTGLTADVAAGTGYLRVGNDLKQVTWTASNIAVAAEAPNYIYCDQFGVVQSATSEPSSTSNINLGKCLTGTSASLFASSQGAIVIQNFGPNIDRFNKYALGPLYVSGSIVSENTITPRAIDVTSGFYFFSSEERHPNAATAAIITSAYHVAGINTLANVVQIDNTKYDNGANLVNLTASYFNKFTIYGTGDGATATYFMQHGTGNFATLDEAKAAPIPASYIPTEGKPAIASIIVQQGNPNIVAILDVRPKLGGAGAGSTSGVSNHGDLTGLAADDHTQYLLASGTRAMTGNLNLNSNNVLNAGTINSVNIGSHATRHLPNGADPLATAAPATSLSLATSNAVGTANSLARSDHSHAITGVQTLSSELTALAALSATGLARRTGSGTWSAGSTVDLATEASGNLSVARLNSGTSASSSTFWRGDGTWATPAAQSITLTGDATGSGTGSIAVTLANTSVTPGTYLGFTVDAKGRITNTVSVTTLAGYGIVDAVQSTTVPSISANILANRPTFGVSGRLFIATDTLSLFRDSGSAWKLVNPAISGDVSIAAGGAVATLAASGVTAGTYKSLTVDAKGRVMAGTNPTTLAGYAISDAVRNNGGTSGVQTGVLSARPTAASAGRIYIATDTGTMFSDSGSVWTAIGSAPTQVFGGTAAQSSGTSIIPAGTSAPISSDGSQLWTQAIAPSQTSSKIAINFSAMVATNSSADRFVTVAIFRGSTFIGASSMFFTNPDQPQSISLSLVDAPNTVSSTVYSARIGVNNTATWYLNRTSGITHGGANPSGWTITEIN